MAASDTPRNPFAILRILGLIAVTNAGIVLITAWCLPTSNGFTLFVAWVGNVVLVLVSAMVAARQLRAAGWLILPIAGYILFSFIYGIMGGHIPKVFRIRETPAISVKEADRYPAHDVYHFSDGRVNMRYAFLKGSRSGRYGPLYYHVAPVVAEDWKEGDAFTVWVAWNGRSEFPPASWQKDFRGGYDAALEASYADLIRERIDSNHLASRLDAPILCWDEHPKESLLARAWLELWILLGLDAAVFLSLLIPEFISRGPSSSK